MPGQPKAAEGRPESAAICCAEVRVPSSRTAALASAPGLLLQHCSLGSTVLCTSGTLPAPTHCRRRTVTGNAAPCCCPSTAAASARLPSCALRRCSPMPTPMSGGMLDQVEAWAAGGGGAAY